VSSFAEVISIKKNLSKVKNSYLFRLFKTIEIPLPGMYSVSTSPNPITTPGPQHNIKLSCDRHLLVAAHKNIGVGPVLAVLKGILGNNRIFSFFSRNIFEIFPVFQLLEMQQPKSHKPAIVEANVVA
jgi:hypothetical protein